MSPFDVPGQLKGAQAPERTQALERALSTFPFSSPSPSPVPFLLRPISLSSPFLSLASFLPQVPFLL
jgi:hypothetical protein